MDSKISEFAVADTLSATASIPIVDGGANKKISGGVFSLNMPNLGNRGITKNAVIQVATPIIPLTGTLMTLPVIGTPYTLPNGSDGQEIVLVSSGANVVVPTSSYVASVTMGVGSTITLIFVGGTFPKWFPKSYHNCTLT